MNTRSLEFLLQESTSTTAGAGTFTVNGVAIGGDAVPSDLTDVTQALIAVVTTLTPHGLANGTSITIADIVGMTELNGNTYYAKVLTGSTFELYTDAALTTRWTVVVMELTQAVVLRRVAHLRELRM